MERIIYLVCERGTGLINYATTDEKKAQRASKKAEEITSKEQDINRENWGDLQIKLRIELRKEFKIKFDCED